jgi:hypothetical protein
VYVSLSSVCMSLCLEVVSVTYQYQLNCLCTHAHTELRDAAYGDTETFLRIAESLAQKKAQEVCA